jgi:hypothetical protein
MSREPTSLGDPQASVRIEAMGGTASGTTGTVKNVKGTLVCSPAWQLKPLSTHQRLRSTPKEMPTLLGSW